MGVKIEENLVRINVIIVANLWRRLIIRIMDCYF